MAEADFQTELGRGFAALLPEAHYHKLRDMPNFLARQQANRGYVNLKNPYDCFALNLGVFYAMELKQPRGMSLATQSPTSGGLNPEQEAALLQVELAGGVGLVAVNFLTALSAKERKRRGGPEVLNVAFGARISAVVDARRELGRDSIPLSWWESSSNVVQLDELRVEGKPAWDPRPLIGLDEGRSRVVVGSSALKWP